MKKLFLFLFFALFSIFAFAQEGISNTIEEVKQMTEMEDNNKLVVVWTSGDKEVAMKMVFMYTYNAQKYGWWDDITLLVWGPSSKLLSEDKELQDYVKEMKDIGVNLLACKGCSDLYDVSDHLEKLGITVKYTGKDLTDFIKNRHVVTF